MEQARAFCRLECRDLFIDNAWNARYKDVFILAFMTTVPLW